LTENVRVAIAGLGFGAEFIPIYQAHPDAELVAVCQRSPDTLDRVAGGGGGPRPGPPPPPPGPRPRGGGPAPGGGAAPAPRGPRRAW
jgi:predicted dehydrogenase